MMRLDKFLADMNVGTRSEVKQYIRKGLIHVNGKVVTQPQIKVELEDCITYEGKEISYIKYVYYMLHKPAGVISAREDKRDTTVLDLLEGVDTKDVFPVGRLDKDTEGLLLLTNDGPLSHGLLSPKKHVDKIYFAEILGQVTLEDVAKFQEGLDIGEKKHTLPAELKILEVRYQQKYGKIEPTSGNNQALQYSEIQVRIQEGKFHQIKRMFQAVGKEVVYLKRLQMGTLVLDEQLKPGEFRPLTKEEVEGLC